MREGPLYTTQASCDGCKHCNATYYQRQGDSGVDVRCTKADRDVGFSWNTPAWCPLAKRDVDVVRLRARVVVNAEDVTAAGITLEHIKAWLTARGWGPIERGITVDDPVRGKWRLWERRPTPEEQVRREAFRKAAKRWPSRASDELNIAIYDENTPAQLADLIAGIARTLKLVGLDLVDALAESVSAEARSDQA